MAGRLDWLMRSGIDEPSSEASLRSQYFLFAALATALPLAILLSVEVWMTTAYTSVLDHASFMDQYYTSVFRYRILGRDLLLHLYHFLSAHLADKPYPLPRDRDGSFLFYYAYVISNGIYFLLANGLLLSLLWIKKRGFRDCELLLYFYYTLLLAMSMAVVTPYDQLAYLLLLIGVVGVRVKSRAIGALLVALSALAGTLNRETEFLFAAFLVALALFSPKALAKRYWIYLVIDLCLSLCAYVGVRLALPGKLNLIQDVTFGGKWGIESLVVLAVLLSVGAIFALRLYSSVRPLAVFLVCCLPYLLTVFIGGVFRELRLMVPILLLILCLYHLLARSTEEPFGQRVAAP
jgi:hypothetical protein